MAPRSINSISICTGSGMLDIAAELASDGAIRPILYVEREAFAAAVLVEAMQKGFIPQVPIWSDVRSVASVECGDYLRRVNPEMLIGGIPCQPHSLAGKRLGRLDERDLWDSCLEILGAYPSIRLLFVENVSGILSSDGGDRICRDLESLGWRVAGVIATAWEVGANHKRERMFFVGERELDDASGFTNKFAIRDQSETNGEVESGRPSNGSNRKSTSTSGALADSAREDEQRFKANGFRKNANRRSRSGMDNAASRNARRGAGTQPADGHSELGLFAPGPGERERWEFIISRDATLAPAIGIHEIAKAAHQKIGVAVSLDDAKTRKAFRREFRFLAHGLADSRTDRLRLAGNGVSPLAAAYAFIVGASCVLFGSNVNYRKEPSRENAPE